MQRQPLFVRTSRGYLNLGLVRLIEEGKENWKFVFDDPKGAYLELPANEGYRVLTAMVNEMLVCAE